MTLNIIKTSLMLNVPEISKLNGVFSEKVLIQGLPWKVRVCKDNIGEPSLAVFLNLASNESDKWTHPIRSTFTLLSFGGSEHEVKYHIDPYSIDHFGSYGTPLLIKWKVLFAAEYNIIM